MVNTTLAHLTDGTWKKIGRMTVAEIIDLLRLLDRDPWGDIQPTYFSLRAELKKRSLATYNRYLRERQESLRYLATADAEIGLCPNCLSESLIPANHLEGYSCLKCDRTTSLDDLINDPKQHSSLTGALI